MITKEPEVDIREAQSKDLPEFEKLFLIIRQATFSWENLKNLKLEDYGESTKGEKVFVAENSKKIIGFISLWLSNEINFIHNLFVYPEFQRMNIGKSLLGYSFNIAPSS